MFEDKEIVITQKHRNSVHIDMKYIGSYIARVNIEKERCIQMLLDQNQTILKDIITNCCHFVIKINDHHILQLANINGLTLSKNKRVLQNLTNDFGSMTNQILKLSEYYADHQFVTNKEQRKSTLN